MSASPSERSVGDGVEVFEKVVFGKDIFLIAVGVSTQFVSLPVCERIFDCERDRRIVSCLPLHAVDSSCEEEQRHTYEIAVEVEQGKVDFCASSLDVFLLCDGDEVVVDSRERDCNRVGL